MEKKTKKPKSYCHDPRHGAPCPLPCAACVDECGRGAR